MFADAEVKLPAGVGTSTPEEVAAAVVTGIERNKGEVDVAPLPMRLSTVFASLAPETAGASRAASARTRSRARWQPASATSAELSTQKSAC